MGYWSALPRWPRLKFTIPPGLEVIAFSEALPLLSLSKDKTCRARL